MPSFLCFAHIIHGGLLCSRSALTVNNALIIADPMYPGVHYMVNLFLKEYCIVVSSNVCYYVVTVKSTVEILQNFVAFSEYMDFIMVRNVALSFRSKDLTK